MTIAREVISRIAVADLRNRFGLAQTKNCTIKTDSGCGCTAEALRFQPTGRRASLGRAKRQVRD